MNLQHWIDQHPSAFAAIFPIYFLCLWLLVGAILSLIGGWFLLAKVYRARVPFHGTKWRGQSGQMRWLTNYNRVLTLGTSQEGLYLASMFLFRFMHPPLLIPWSEIKVRRKKGWVFEYVIFTMGTSWQSLCGFVRSWQRGYGVRLETVGQLRRREWRNGARSGGADSGVSLISPPRDRGA